MGGAALTGDGGSSVNGDGTSNIGSLATIPASLAGASVSFECWVDIPAANVRGPFMGVGTYGSNGWAVGVGGTTMDNDGHQLILLHEAVAWKPTGHTLSTGTHHIVVTRSAANLFTCYVDDVSVYSSTFTPNAPTGSLHVGGSGNVARVLTSTVTVDNVAMFASELSSARVTAHYASGSGDNAAVAADSPVVFLKFDDPLFLDSSPNARPLDVMVTTASLTPDQAGPVIGGEAVSWAAAAGYVRTTSSVSHTVGTLEAWVYVTGYPSAATVIVAAGPNDGSNGSPFNLAILADGRPQLGIVTTGNASIAGSSALSLNTWHHITGSVGAAGARLRVDKVTVASSATTAFASLTNMVWVRGAPLSTAAGAMVIAEPALYTTQLTTTRTDAHYDAATSPDVTVTAVPATATAAAPVPTVTASGGVAATPATATAAALPPTVTGSGDATVAAPPATATAAAVAAAVTADAEVLAALATATAAVLAPTVAATVAATVEPPPATASATAVSPSIDDGSGSQNISPPPATATAVALAPLTVLEFATDTSNGFSGRIRGGSATVEITVPVAAAPDTVVRGYRVDKAIALPTPTMIDGRPT